MTKIERPGWYSQLVKYLFQDRRRVQLKKICPACDGGGSVAIFGNFHLNLQNFQKLPKVAKSCQK